MKFFTSLSHATVEESPFPHVVIEDALPSEVCDALISEMPPLDTLAQGSPLGSNRRFSLSCPEASASEKVSDLWKAVLGEAVSAEFLSELTRLFGPAIRESYPDFDQRFGPLESLTAQTRQKTKAAGTIGMDAQIAVNTPALQPGTSVRGPHLDRVDKLFIGLLYLRPGADDSTGGNLELYRPIRKPERYLAKRMLPWDQVEAKRTVPYRRNTLVLFVNTPDALHGVSPRAVTRHPRYFINLVGELSSPLFSVKCEGDEEPVDDWFREAAAAAPPLPADSSAEEPPAASAQKPWWKRLRSRK